MTMREVAAASGIDPSYLTLIERDGYGPKMPLVTALANVLTAKKIEQDELMFLAGYAPANISHAEMMAALDFIYESRGDGKRRTGRAGTRVVSQD